MIGFTRTLALEVVNRGITVNTVCPGWVDTEMATQGNNETAAFRASHRNSSTRERLPVCPSGDFSMKSPSWFVILPWIKPMGITGQAINICGGQTLV